MAALRHFLFKRDLFVVVDAFDLLWLVDVDSGLLELTLLLKLGKSPCLLEFLLSNFTGRFLTFRVC